MTINRNIAILSYHSISYNSDSYSIRPSMFRNHMELIKKNYNIIPLSELIINKNISNKRKLVAVTIDDGYYDFLENALPILKSLMIPSTVFVPTGYIGSYNKWDRHNKSIIKKNIMNKEAILESLRSGIVEFGSHTVDHVSMGNLQPEEMYWQALESKRTLEGIVGSPMNIFSYPYGMLGDYTYETTQAIKKTGYKIGVTSRYGTNSRNNNLLCMKRLIISDKDTSISIKLKINGFYNFMSLKERIVYNIRNKIIPY